ncbi:MULTISPECIES: precorrin-6A reductase [Bacillus]|uniref:precorrin-6A reductase n=1 Tax=Bacillus TaxID=1386 RepID=UPI0002E0775E|nr:MULTISPECIES: precorrin-6A reductase [Bacillus]
MILFLAGTSDARELAISIEAEGYPVLATVVTESAANSLKAEGLHVHIGRLTAEDMEEMIRKKNFKAIVDASHPFAEETSKNALLAAELANVPYFRYEREIQSFKDDKLIIVKNYEEAANLAAEKRGVIMLTTGSKTLHIFTEKLLGLENTRLLARMLPRLDNMEKCQELGVEQKNIIAIQGPFSKDLNKALFENYGVTLMITKESGKVGSVDEKLEAASENGIETIMISRPKVEYVNVYSDFVDMIAAIKSQVSQKKH